MSTCTSCGARLLWCSSARTGAKMPLDAEPVADGTVVVEDGRGYVLTPLELAALPAETPRYQSHFASCPQAARHRRKT